MYQAPIKPDDRRTAIVPAPDDLPPPTTSAERQVAAARADVLWRTAPTLAGVVLLTTVLGTWFLADAARPLTVISWAITVCVGVALLCRERRAAASLPDRQLARAELWTAAKTTALALVWLSLPAATFVGDPPAVKAVIAGLVCLLMASGVLLAVLPAAVASWSCLLGIALVGMLVADSGWAALPYVTLVLAYLVALLTGAAHAARLVRAHVGISADVQGRCEAVELLLAEYEQQGLGWLWQTDANNVVTYASSRASTLLGLPRGSITGQSLPMLLGRDPRLGEALVAHETFHNLEIEVRTPSGSRWVALSGSPITDADHRFHGFRGVGADVSEWRRSQARLTHLAASDVLTGLPNRQRVRELIGDALDRARDAGRACALLFMDLDGFKPVNDSFGHARGDAVLRMVAERLIAEVGAQGVVGRLGGDEFAVVVEGAESRNMVQALGERLIGAIADPFLLGNGAQVRIGVSVGCAFGPIDAATVDELVGRADLALYNSKSHGRGTFRFFDPNLQKEADERRRFEDDLALALERGQFQLHYQPLVATETREVVGFEALIRWQHPTRGMVSPALFIPVAEELGLIGAIGDWVIRTATRDAATWPDHVRVAVNVSACQLHSEALPNTIAEALARAKMPANRLEVEVTESVFLGDSDDVLDVLRRVRGLGCGIALDDFGTGYSSLGYLNKTIFHKLKIDGSFVREAAKRQETVAIIRAIVSIAESFRMTIVAEGVEKTEDFLRMKDLGCHVIQGYLFGKPMPYEKTLDLVGTRWERKLAQAS